MTVLLETEPTEVVHSHVQSFLQELNPNSAYNFEGLNNYIDVLKLNSDKLRCNGQKVG